MSKGSKDSSARALLEGLSKDKLVDMILDSTVIIRRLEAKLAKARAKPRETQSLKAPKPKPASGPKRGVRVDTKKG